MLVDTWLQRGGIFVLTLLLSIRDSGAHYAGEAWLMACRGCVENAWFVRCVTNCEFILRWRPSGAPRSMDKRNDLLAVATATPHRVSGKQESIRWSPTSFPTMSRYVSESSLRGASSSTRRGETDRQSRSDLKIREAEEQGSESR